MAYPGDPYRMSFNQGMPRPGNVTKALVGLLVAASLGVSLLERRFPGTLRALVFDRDAILHGEVWRLVTYPWIKTSPLGLGLAAVVLYLFCSAHERMWGSQRLLRFVLISLVGAGLLAVPLGLVLGALMPFVDSPLASGPDAAIDAMLMAAALQAPRSQVMFGFVLPMEARTFVWLMVGFEIVGGIMNQVAQLSLTIGGLTMGYLLVTGYLRPDRALRAMTGAWRRRQMRRRLWVVPPKRPDRNIH
jgi:membrane associated rhomboid family serine protease